MMQTLKWVPSPAESMSFSRRLEAVNDPAGVWERLASVKAELALEAAETIRDVYPRIFAKAQQRAIERITESPKDIPYRQRVQMSVFYKLPLDSALDPVNLKITQSVYDRKPSTPAPVPGVPSAAPPTPAVANPVDLSQAYMPSMDRR